MDIEQATTGLPEFRNWNHADKIRFFAWFLHTHRGKQFLRESDVRDLYDELHLNPPGNIGSFLRSLSTNKARELLHSRDGYRLERSVRDRFNEKYGQRDRALQVTRLLADLPTKVTNLAGRQYLDEALVCFRNGAFRAAIVMSWNLAYDHLCEFVLAKKLTEFNTQLPKTYPKADISVIKTRDDFSELKESQVLQVCRSANITSDGVHKILKEKLDRRNVAAHPSGVQVKAPTAEEYIIDLITNVVLNPNLS